MVEEEENESFKLAQKKFECVIHPAPVDRMIKVGPELRRCKRNLNV